MSSSSLVMRSWRALLYWMVRTLIISLAFEVAARGTPAEGAELRINEVEAGLRCRTCGFDDVLRLEPEAVAVVKRLVLGCATRDDRAVLDDAAESLVGLLRRPQAAEGIRHFMAKTLPPWAKEQG